jgi:hypothetical protein
MNPDVRSRCSLRLRMRWPGHHQRCGTLMSTNSLILIGGLP